MNKNIIGLMKDMHKNGLKVTGTPQEFNLKIQSIPTNEGRKLYFILYQRNKRRYSFDLNKLDENDKGILNLLAKIGYDE